MDNKYNEHFIITQATIESNKKYMKANKQDSNCKTMNVT